LPPNAFEPKLTIKQPNRLSVSAKKLGLDSVR
jgi:hypothetical protein